MMKKGFTLIELMLYMLILASMLGVLATFIEMTFQTRIKSQTVAEVEQQGAQTMDIITQTIRNATAVNSPVIQASGSSLSLDTAHGASTPTAFDLNNGKIQIKEGTGAVVELSSDKLIASDLVFTNVTESSSPGSVRVQFTLTYNNISGRNEYDFTKTFYGTASLR